MSPIILLCVLLQAFSTCSLVDSGVQPQGILSGEDMLEGLRAAFSEASKSGEDPTLFLGKLVKLGQVAEGFWNMCLDKTSAYSANQEFFKNTLSNFIAEYSEFDLPLAHTAATLSVEMKIFCELQSRVTYLESLSRLGKFFKDGGNPFEGLSDEFLTIAADYIRSTISIQQLYSMVEDPEIFQEIQPQRVNDPMLKAQLLTFLLRLRVLVKDLQKANLVDIYHHFSSALKATKRTMVPANEAVVEFLTNFLLEETSLLAEKASKCILNPCSQLGLAKSANKIIADIEAITLPLYRAHLELDRTATKRRGSGELCCDNFLESLFAFGSILVKPSLGTKRQISENFSELISTLLNIFLRGEDELWTFRLPARLMQAHTLWRRALESLGSASNTREAMCWLKYNSYLRADLSLMFHILNIVDKLEDPLALDRPTREKFVEFWREAQVLSKLLKLLSVLERLAPHFKELEEILSVPVMSESLSGVFDEQINAVKRQGINFELGRYHQFIDELPGHHEAIAQLLKTFSDNLSRTLVGETVVGMIETIILPLKSPIYTPLKRSLKQLFARSPHPTKPQDLQSHPAKSRGMQSSKRGRKPKCNIKHRKAAALEAPASTNTQVFMHAGPQYVDVGGASGRAEDGLKLLEEDFENSWTVVEASRNRRAFGSLANQPAREILRKFARKPLGWDGIPPTDPRDMRSDKTKVKIATFNVEWLFLFNLSTDKLYGKIKWKSLEEAWDHIRDIADVIRKINADIICLCEVQDMRILSILVELLPDLNYRAYLIPNHDSLGQNVGILTRVDTHASISKIDGRLAPKSIVFHIKLDNGRGGLVDLALTGVHLISSTAEADHAERARHREDQARALKQHLKFYYDTSGHVIHLVLGDFNMVDPGLLPVEAAHLSGKALEVIKDEDFHLFNIMDSKTTPGNRVPLPNSVCHIFTTHPLLASRSQLFSFNDADAPSRLERVSDHLPIVTTIDLLKHCQ